VTTRDAAWPGGTPCRVNLGVDARGAAFALMAALT
jgi:hypothetical protein